MENLLSEMRGYAAANRIPVMLFETEKILREQLKKHSPKRILEIGTAIGLSGIIMLSECGNALLYTVEIDEKAADTAVENFKKAGVRQRVTLWRGDALEIVRYLTGSFDFILLDGPKGHYYELLPYLKKLLPSGGVLFADNVLFKGYTQAEKIGHKHRTIVNSLREYLADIQGDAAFESGLLSIGDGISIAIKK